MDAAPILARIARVMREIGLEAITIGNAAAALHGALVTTVDIDFLFRKTPANLRKLKKMARSLDATVLRPYYPVSNFYRVMADDQSLQVDFMATVHGLRSFNTVTSRAISVDISGAKAWLHPSLISLQVGGRAIAPGDHAVLDALTRTLKKQKGHAPREAPGPQAGK